MRNPKNNLHKIPQNPTMIIKNTIFVYKTKFMEMLLLLFIKKKQYNVKRMLN
jgi:hypothetical protein